VSRSGEIEVAGSLFLGYLGEAGTPPAAWPSGDLGEIDADGYLWIRDRRKHVLITAFGRNVGPEWVETELRNQPAIAQAVVFGDARPALSAVLWPMQGEAHDATLQAAVDAANAALPDYARIARWVRAAAPFDAASGLATANGRPKRDAIAARHADALDLLLHDEPMTTSFHERLLEQTADARRELVTTPIIQGCLRGEVSLPSYLAFLREAYHHVSHTVPLLRACRAALPPRLHWIHDALDEYIEEEAGHDEWILDDIAACGGDADAVRRAPPATRPR
jgi:hypothetical protein